MPITEAIQLVVTLVSVVSGIFGIFKMHKAQTKTKVITQVATTLIKGIESYNDTTAQFKSIKEHIRDQSYKDFSYPQLNAMVQDITDNHHPE